jgi:hypothetical protein
MNTPFFVSKSTKSVGIAILLTLLFGPLGLFYASVTGGLIMTFTPILLVILVLVGLFQDNSLLLSWSFGLLIVFAATFWIINIIWAVVSVNNYNKEIAEEANKQFEFWNKNRSATPSQFVVNINQKTEDKILEFKNEKTEINSKPSLQEWLQENPGKSINDYFSKFRPQ